MQILRQCRGVSRTVLTGLIGMSASWVRRVENGQLHTPSLEMIFCAVGPLHVQNLAELTSHKMRIDLFSGPGHPQLPTVTDAVNSFPINSSEQARSAAYLQAHPSRTWAARHCAPNHRDAIDELPPGLIQDFQLELRQAELGTQRHRPPSETYSLSHFFITYQPDAALKRGATERGLGAPDESRPRPTRK
ncbi:MULTISPECIES: helix-turn-helix domain-containing protein [Streptomyces]|uniref:helix-turn-helix domain-containing protein n=1 Tax=Streptomyces TaxID=1883 RepID=UPI000B9E062F|nr:helix-turn-helix transcriptional regulator [Streptomyces kasugaensis]